MPSIQIGTTAVPYELVHSVKVQKRRIETGPEAIRVIVPHDDRGEDIEAFLRRKERWLFEQYDRIREHAYKRPYVPRYLSGAKIPYRGRMMMLTVNTHDGDAVEVKYKNGFQVYIPQEAEEHNRDVIIEDALRLWMRRRLRRDARSMANKYARQTGLQHKGVRVRDIQNHWGTCGRDGYLYINWHLIFAPKPVLEYVIVHELCHLRYRNHSNAFWGLVEAILPDYQRRKSWLDNNEHMLSISQKTHLPEYMQS